MSDDVTALISTQTRPATPLAVLEKRIAQSRKELKELWAKASPADRIFAVDRLLREDLVPAGLAGKLQRVHDAVRDAWVTARMTSALDGSVPADAHLAGLQLTIAERDRDNFLHEHALFDTLFFASEGYLRSAPVIMQGSFRDLVQERARLRARLVPILPPIDDATDAR